MGFEYTVNGNDKGLSYIFLEQAKKLDGFDESKQIDWNQVMNVFDEIQQEKQSNNESLFSGGTDKTKKGYGSSYTIKKNDKIQLSDADLNKIYTAMGVDLNKSKGVANLAPKDQNPPQNGANLSNKTATLTDLEKAGKKDIQDGETTINNQIVNYYNGYVSSISDKNNYVQRMILRNNDGSINSFSDYENDVNGNPVKMYIYDNNGKLMETREFVNGSNGRALRTISRNPDGTVKDYTDWQYDSSGKTTKQTERNADGSAKGVYYYQYENLKDTNGNITGSYEYQRDALTQGRISRQIERDKNGNVIGVYEYEHDISGKKSKQVEKDAAGNIISTSEIENDEYGRNMKRIRKNLQGSVTGIFESEYDSSGRRIKLIEKDANGNVKFYTIYSEWDSNTKDPIKGQKYDAKGHMINVKIV